MSAIKFFACSVSGEAQPEPRTFAFALAALREGQQTRRRTWDPTSSIALRGENIVHLATSDRGVHATPWLATHRSLLADDWEIVRRRR